MKATGQEIAYYKWGDEPHSWNEVAEHFGQPREAVRSAARKYKEKHSEEFGDRSKVTFKGVGNQVDVTYTGPNFTSLDDLLKYLDIDTEVWNAYSWTAHPYQGFSKNEKKDLTFDEGKISGTLKTGGHLVTTMWSITVKMVKRHPDPIFPTVQPVACDYQYTPQSAPGGSGLKTAFIISDLQAGFTRDFRTAKLDPFHDRKLLDAALQICKDTQPDVIILAGDILDLPDFSDKFVRSPEFTGCVQPAVLEVHWYLRDMREACPDSDIYMLEGNHGKRITDALAKHIPAAYGLKSATAEMMELPPALSIPGLLNLELLGIEWVGGYPDSVVYLREDIKVEHGDKVKPQPDNGLTFVGHTHRQGRKGNTRWTQSGAHVDTVIEIGCACRLDKVPGVKKRQNWHQGFACVEYDPEGELYADTPVTVINGKCIFNGMIYEGRDRTNDLIKVFPEWNW